MEVEQLEVSQENASSRQFVILGAVDPGPVTSDYSKKIDTFHLGIFQMISIFSGQLERHIKVPQRNTLFGKDKEADGMG